MKRLNGWQRLWVVLTAIYFIALIILAVAQSDRYFSGGMLGLIGPVLAPPSALYLVGSGMGWVFGGFRDYGIKSALPWQRLWVFGSAALLICTGGQLIERIRHAVIADHVLSASLSPDESARYSVSNDDYGVREVYAQFTKKGSWDWVRLGRAVNPDSQSILERNGEYNSNVQHWSVSREVAVSLLKKYEPNDFMFDIISALARWVLPPLAIYLFAYGFIMSSIWVYAGFKKRKTPASA